MLGYIFVTGHYLVCMKEMTTFFAPPMINFSKPIFTYFNQGETRCPFFPKYDHYHY